jgi:PAS domain S-box-containing protein
MSLATALNFFALGSILLVLSTGSSRASYLIQSLALVIIVMNMVAFFGYIYSPQALYQFYAYTTMALHTALLFIALGFGVLFARSDQGLMATITNPHSGGMMARRILPVAIIVPFVIGWLQLTGEHAGLYAAEFGLTLSATANIVIITLVIWLSARSLNQEDANRRQAEERFRWVVEAAPNGVIMVNQAGTIWLINHVAEELFGYEPETLLGTSIDPLLLSYDQTTLLAGEQSGQRRDGVAIPLEVSLASIQMGQTLFTLITVVDITERQQAVANQRNLAAQLRQAQKMEAIGQLAGGIAHDFNNLLVSILGFTELAKLAVPVDSEAVSDLDQVTRAAHRAGDLTKQILAISRKQVLDVKIVDLNETIRSLEQMVTRTIREDIELRTFLQPALDRVRVDPAQVEQVLMNLIVNAQDSMPHGGKLTIKTDNIYLDEEYVAHQSQAQVGHHVMIAVSDTGQGMDAATQEHIFEPFFTTKPRGKGTGLGLATVHGIVNQHGGNIWVYSEPDQGTIFKIYLPRSTDHQVSETPPAVSIGSVEGTEVVLVVEDEPLVRRLVCETLKKHGYHILEASSATEAIDLSSPSGQRIDLLLTDVIMPQMNGKALYQALQPFQPQLEVIYMSGYADDIIIHHGILEEGINFIQKPFTLQLLTTKVRQVLNG